MQTFTLLVSSFIAATVFSGCSSFGVPPEESIGQLIVSNTGVDSASGGLSLISFGDTTAIRIGEANTAAKDGNGVTYDFTTNQGFQVARDIRTIIRFQFDSTGQIVTKSAFTLYQTNSLRGIAYDGIRDILYVADNVDKCIYVYESASKIGYIGNAAASHKLDLIAEPWGITLANDNLIVAYDQTNVVQLIPSVSNKRSFIGSDDIMQVNSLRRMHGVTYDAKSNTLLLTDIGLAVSGTDSSALPFNKDGAIYVIENALSKFNGYAITANRIISGNATNLGNPVDIAYDGRVGREKIYVAEKANKAVLIFDGKANGNVAPTTISRNQRVPESLDFHVHKM